MLPYIKAISIEGAKGVGKTRTAEQHANTIYRMDQRGVRESIEAEFELLHEGPFPTLVDEWQYLPEVWDSVRRMVDGGMPPGSIIMTGSRQSNNLSLHSGAGRIVSHRMRPLSLAERYPHTEKLTLKNCFADKTPDQFQLTSTVTFSDYMQEIVKTGFPDINAAPDFIRDNLIDSYIDSIATREFKAQGITLRQPEALIRWMRAYAAATGTTTSYNKILDAATPGESDKPSRKTTIAYREALSSLWLLDDLPYWGEGEGFFGRLKQTSKHYLADPGLEARLLGLRAQDLIRGEGETIHDSEYGSIAGRLFESLCVLSVRAYASQIGARTYFMRNAKGTREIDLVIEKDRKLVIAEIKLGISVSNNDVRHLNWFEDKLGSRVKEKIILTTGNRAYRRKDGVLVVPAVLFG